MRLLFVVQGHSEQDQIGYTSAARQLLVEGVLPNLTFFFLIMKSIGPHISIIFFQY
jgi:hypothetical protein